MYYRNAAAAIVVYDITNAESFEKARRWVDELRAQGSPGCVIALAGNKTDLEDQRQVSSDAARGYAEEAGLIFLETSAKAKSNVDTVFREVRKMYRLLRHRNFTQWNLLSFLCRRSTSFLKKSL